MSSFRLWLFRSLVAVAGGLIVTSFIMPWWTANMTLSNGIQISLPQDVIRIYTYGLRHELVELAQYITADETPFYQTVLAWIFIAVSVVLLLFSTWLKGGKGRWLLGSIGLIYITYAVIAVIWIAIRTGDFGISLQGTSFAEGPVGIGGAIIYANIRFGYYLAYVAGVMCIALAFFRNKIIGKPKLVP